MLEYVEKRKYLSLGKPNQTKIGNSKLPNFVPYKFFSKEIEAIEKEKLHEIRGQGKVCLFWLPVKYIVHIPLFYTQFNVFREETLKTSPEIMKEKPDSFFFIENWW